MEQAEQDFGLKPSSGNTKYMRELAGEVYNELRRSGAEQHTEHAGATATQPRQAAGAVSPAAPARPPAPQLATGLPPPAAAVLAPAPAAPAAAPVAAAAAAATAAAAACATVDEGQQRTNKQVHWAKQLVTVVEGDVEGDDDAENAEQHSPPASPQQEQQRPATSSSGRTMRAAAAAQRQMMAAMRDEDAAAARTQPRKAASKPTPAASAHAGGVAAAAGTGPQPLADADPNIADAAEVMVALKQTTRKKAGPEAAAFARVVQKLLTTAQQWLREQVDDNQSLHDASQRPHLDTLVSRLNAAKNSDMCARGLVKEIDVVLVTLAEVQLTEDMSVL